MKGQIRGLALELLRQECVSDLDAVGEAPESLEAVKKAETSCGAYDKALHNKGVTNDT